MEEVKKRNERQYKNLGEGEKRGMSRLKYKNFYMILNMTYSELHINFKLSKTLNHICPKEATGLKTNDKQ